jgi:lysyl-tRNA synthetase class II
MDAEHAQDYTQMEFYWAYADWNDGMQFIKELFDFIPLLKHMSTIHDVRPTLSKIALEACQ